MPILIKWSNLQKSVNKLTPKKFYEIDSRLVPIHKGNLVNNFLGESMKCHSPKMQVDEMAIGEKACWWNNKYMKQQDNERVVWWNGRLMNFQVDDMLSWWNDKLIKWQVN